MGPHRIQRLTNASRHQPSHVGYDHDADKGNLAGSLCSLSLFLPHQCTGGKGTDFKFLEWLDPCGMLGSKIKELGLENQKSGKGPNSCRYGFIEAAISSLGERPRASTNAGRT